jgi:hypothetical protein
MRSYGLVVSRRPALVSLVLLAVCSTVFLVYFTGEVREIQKVYNVAEVDALGQVNQVAVEEKKKVPGRKEESDAARREREAANEVFRGKDIVILTGYHSETNRSDMAIKNREEYAELHGYIHHAIDLSKYESQNHPCDKILAVRETKKKFKDSKWVWWLDEDAIIMNPSVDLGQHVLNPDVLIKKIAYNEKIRNVDTNFQVADVATYLQHKTEIMHSKLGMVITQDLLSLDTNSFFIRNQNAYGDMILDLWEENIKTKDRDYMRPEQDSLVRVLVNHRRLKAGTAIVQQELINAGIRDVGTVGPNNFYRKGDFVVQFSSCRYNDMCMVVWNILAPNLVKDFGKQFSTKGEVEIVLDV